jgi:TatD DNase family protein
MIDFHCHLDLYPDARELLPKVATMNHFTLVVTTSPRAWQATSRVFAGHENVKVALGMHPEIVEEKAAERALLVSGVAETDFIGEVGLDGSVRNSQSAVLQESILKDVLTESERCGGRILSIHSRNAASRVLDLLEQHCEKSIPVLHWFSGSVQETRRAVSMGCWFSVGPAMIRGEKAQRILRELPRDKVLPETDGPFAKNGSVPFMPWEAMTIVETIASVWNTTQEHVRDQMKDNLVLLLSAQGFPALAL